MSADAFVDYVESTAVLKNASEFGSINYPEVKVRNPNKALFGTSDTITIPPSGDLMGAYARTDSQSEVGYFQQPGGVIRGFLPRVLGVADDSVKKRPTRDRLYSANINPIWGDRGIPYHVDGSANLKRNGSFPSIGECRGSIVVAISIKDALFLKKHDLITDELLESYERESNIYLLRLTRKGAFATRDPKLAFFTDAGKGLNPPSERFARRTHLRVGIATGKPNEQINLLLGQDVRALQQELIEYLS